MKISKLFHWLYAILMLTPVSAVGVTCLTHVFNKEVSEETQTATINYKYELGITPTTAIESRGKLWKLNIDNTINISIPVKYVYDGTNIYQSTDERYLDIFNNEISISNDFGALVFDNDNTYIVPTYLNVSDLSLLSSGVNEYNQIQSVAITVNPQDQTTNIFYDSCEQVKDSFVLNWCDNNNPVREVFNYGSALFNVDSDNLVNYFLTYWLSISIIWLVFDVFVYVPLLVHRWIDKAKLE